MVMSTETDVTNAGTPGRKVFVALTVPDTGVCHAFATDVCHTVRRIYREGCMLCSHEIFVIPTLNARHARHQCFHFLRHVSCYFVVQPVHSDIPNVPHVTSDIFRCATWASRCSKSWSLDDTLWTQCHD